MVWYQSAPSKKLSRGTAPNLASVGVEVPTYAAFLGVDPRLGSAARGGAVQKPNGRPREKLDGTSAFGRCDLPLAYFVWSS